LSRNILTQRLNRLVEGGILKRVPYCDHPPGPGASAGDFDRTALAATP
jgi:DNA-binding HxlR family transcriptional regulator